MRRFLIPLLAALALPAGALLFAGPAMAGELTMSITSVSPTGTVPAGTPVTVNVSLALAGQPYSGPINFSTNGTTVTAEGTNATAEVLSGASGQAVNGLATVSVTEEVTTQGQMGVDDAGVMLSAEVPAGTEKLDVAQDASAKIPTTFVWTPPAISGANIDWSGEVHTSIGGPPVQYLGSGAHGQGCVWSGLWICEPPSASQTFTFSDPGLTPAGNLTIHGPAGSSVTVSAHSEVYSAIAPLAPGMIQGGTSLGSKTVSATIGANGTASIPLPQLLQTTDPSQLRASAGNNYPPHYSWDITITPAGQSQSGSFLVTGNYTGPGSTSGGGGVINPPTGTVTPQNPPPYRSEPTTPAPNTPAATQPTPPVQPIHTPTPAKTSPIKPIPDPISNPVPAPVHPALAPVQPIHHHSALLGPAVGVAAGVAIVIAVYRRKRRNRKESENHGLEGDD